MKVEKQPSFKGSTLPETKIATENGWLEDDRFLLVPSLYFRGELLVSGKVIFRPHHIFRGKLAVSFDE